MFSNLPNEAKLHILSFLNLGDIRRVAQVSQELQVFTEDNHLKVFLLLKRYAPKLALMVKDEKVTLKDAANSCLYSFQLIKKRLNQNRMDITICGPFPNPDNVQFDVSRINYAAFSPNGVVPMTMIDIKPLCRGGVGENYFCLNTLVNNVHDKSKLQIKSYIENRIAIILSDNIDHINIAAIHLADVCQVLNISCPFMMIVGNKKIDLASVNYPGIIDYIVTDLSSSQGAILRAIYDKIIQTNGYTKQISLLQSLCQEDNLKLVTSARLK